MTLVNNVERWEGFAKPIGKVLTVLYVASVVVLVGLAGFGVFTLVASDAFFASEHFRFSRFSLELNGVLRYQINPAVIPEGASFRGIFTSIAVAGTVYAITVLLVLRRLREITQTVVIKQPFDSQNPQRILQMAWLVILSAFVAPASNGWVASRMIDTFSLEDFSIVYSPDVYLALTGFLLVILAGVFAYGCYLLQEIDQTV